MGYARGRFGVEYQPRRSEGHPLLWVVVTVVLLVSCAFTYYQLSHRKSPPVAVPQPDGVKSPVVKTSSHEVRPVRASRPPAPPTNVIEKTVSPVGGAVRRAVVPMPAAVPPSKPDPSSDPNVLRVQKWIETSQDRPAEERVRLERLLAAERDKNIPLAIDTIQKLCSRPAMADLQDVLLRRLGDLNLQLLFSGQNNPLITSVIAKRGDSRDRIARENRTTTTALMKLNPKIKWDRLKPGDTVRILFVPNPMLVVYKQRGYADLSIKNGQFFGRYDLTTSKNAKCAVYPISTESGESVFVRFRELGLKAPKRAEIEMFLAPGSRIIIAE